VFVFLAFVYFLYNIIFAALFFLLFVLTLFHLVLSFSFPLLPSLLLCSCKQKTKQKRNHCNSDPNWSKYNNADMMFEPGKVSWSSNPTGGTCFSFVELELPASFNTNVNQIALQIECKVDDSSFSNWQTTNSGSQIRVGYCGFDMVQVWTTDDTLGSTDVAEADAYKWGVTVLTEQHNDFTSSSKNTNQKQLEMGDWVYKTGLNPNERIVVTPSESGTNAKRVVVGDGASRGSFNDDKYRQCGQSGSPVNPCEEMHVGFVSRINVQSISKEFTLPAHGNNEGQRTGKIKIEFRSWAIDSWDNGETSWLTVDGNVNAAWTGTAKSCIWSNAATASDSSPPQSSTWVKDTSIDVYQPWGYNRGNRGMVCYIDVELWVAVDDTATKITLDFQSTVDQSSGDEYWGFNRLKISTAIIGPDAGNCPGAGCGECVCGKEFFFFFFSLYLSLSLFAFSTCSRYLTFILISIYSFFSSSSTSTSTSSAS